jgi:hypothetical protein
VSDIVAGMCRWQGKIIPVVRFVNGRVLECLPALFRADVAGQVWLLLAVWQQAAPSELPCWRQMQVQWALTLDRLR